MKNWKELAEQARESGYMGGGHLEASLERHLRLVMPELVKDLEQTSDLQAYLTVKVSEAFDRMEKLENQGTDPHTSRDLALADLYPQP